MQPLSTTILNVPYDFPKKNEYNFEPNKELFLKENLVLQPTHLSGDNRIVTAMVSNPTNESFELETNTVLGNIYSVSSEEHEIKEKNQHHFNNVTLPDNYSVELQRSGHLNLTEEQYKNISELIERHCDIFANSQNQLGCTHLIKYVINTGNATPIRKRAYRVSPKQRQEIDKEMDKMINSNVIMKSVSPWAALVILVPKPNGEVRLCIDFRDVNSVTIKDSYPLPRIDDILDSLNGTQYFTTLDLMSGYWQIEMEEASKEKTALISHRGLYECNVMPFGL